MFLNSMSAKQVSIELCLVLEQLLASIHQTVEIDDLELAGIVLSSASMLATFRLVETRFAFSIRLGSGGNPFLNLIIDGFILDRGLFVALFFTCLPLIR